MKMTFYDSMESKIQLAVLHERQKHFEDKVNRLEQELGGKEKSLELLREERDELRVRLEVITQKRTLAKGKVKDSRIFSIGLLCLLSTILINVGTGMFTVNPLKILIIVSILLIAVLLHFMAEFLKVEFTLESGKNEF